MTPDGVQWTTPTGHTCPPEEQDTQPPVYPEALKILIDAMLQALQQRQDQEADQDTDRDPDPEVHPNWIDEDDMDPEDPRWDSYYRETNNLPEPPAQSDEEVEILDRMTIEDYLLRHPNAG